MSTATIGVSDNVGWGRMFALALGLPFLVVVRDEALGIFVSHEGELREWRDNVSVADAPTLSRWLEPTAALSVKVGLRQLPLFDVPVNLLVTAKSRTAERLAPVVGTALREAGEILAEARPDRNARAATPELMRLEHRNAARLVVSALTSLLMRDRRELRDLPTLRLVEQVTSMFASDFAWYRSASSLEKSVLGQLIDRLGHGIDYRSLDPTVLSHVYEEALVTDDDRRRLGIHYTPPDLANRLLMQLPVEVLPPEDRDVLDPACGSGTLLVAAHDRLRALQPDGWTEEQRHRDLAVHLRGIDIDPFATEIARLTLLLHAQPAGNGWNVRRDNSLQSLEAWSDPSIIVSNPPWKHGSTDGHRYQLATGFVLRAIQALRPGGLLGIILPLTWLNATNSRLARTQLTESLEVFEVWRLPEGTFETSSVASAVLLARKRDGLGGSGKRLVREVRKSQLRGFLASEGAVASYVVADAGPDLWRSVPLPTIKAAVCSLDEIAVILSGQQPKSGVQPREDGVPYLHQLSQVAPYGSVSESVLWKLRFPDDFQTGRGKALIGKKKVLVSAARSSTSQWRLRVAVDTLGIAMRNSMRGVAPHDQDDETLLYALLVILGSGFATTFVAASGADRNIPARVLHELPIPTSRRTLEELAQLGRTATRHADEGGAAALQDALRRAEEVVWSAYAVPETDRGLLTARLSGDEAPEGAPRYFSKPPVRPKVGTPLRRYGAVLAVNSQQVRLWVNGVTNPEGVEVDIPVHFPGWLLRAGATFDVRGVDTVHDLQDGTYQYQPNSWADLAFEEVDPIPLQIDA